VFSLENQKNPPFLSILAIGILLGGGGLAGLVYVVFFTDPELFPRWMFFFLWFLALTGIALPVVAYLNRRFASNPPAGEGVLIRQAIWVGIYGGLMAWLQQGRILNIAIGFFLAVGLILVEILIRIGEKARWKPKESDDDE
jgi:hypothetical protein